MYLTSKAICMVDFNLTCFKLQCLAACIFQFSVKYRTSVVLLTQPTTCRYNRLLTFLLNTQVQPSFLDITLSLHLKQFVLQWNKRLKASFSSSIVNWPHRPVTKAPAFCITIQTRDTLGYLTALNIEKPIHRNSKGSVEEGKRY